MQTEKRTLIKNALVVSMNDERTVFENGSVLIVDDKIRAVGRNPRSFVGR